jgi:hypothetical protein
MAQQRGTATEAVLASLRDKLATFRVRFTAGRASSAGHALKNPPEEGDDVRGLLWLFESVKVPNRDHRDRTACAARATIRS